MLHQNPLRLYCQADVNSSGIEAVCLVLDEALLAKLRQSFGLLMLHNLESVAFRPSSARWLSARGEAEGVQTTAQVCRNGDDHWVRLAGAAHHTELSAECEWAYPCAHWFLPVDPEHLSADGLSEMADNNRCLLEELDESDHHDHDHDRLRASFLSAVSCDFLSTQKAAGLTVESCVRVLCDQTLPVVGSPGDLLLMQSMLDDLDCMESHCLDLNDLAGLFQDGNGCWRRLRVKAIGQGGSVSAAMAAIQCEAPDTVAWWFLFRSLESGKRIHQAVKAFLLNHDGVLMTPVVNDAKADSDTCSIVLITNSVAREVPATDYPAEVSS